MSPTTLAFSKSILLMHRWSHALHTQQANECCLRLLSAKYPCDMDFTSQKNIVQKQQIALCGHKMHHVVWPTPICQYAVSQQNTKFHIHSPCAIVPNVRSISFSLVNWTNISTEICIYLTAGGGEHTATEQQFRNDYIIIIIMHSLIHLETSFCRCAQPTFWRTEL